MSVLLSAKNNFDLSNGDLPSMSDQLVEFGSVANNSVSSPVTSTSARLTSSHLLAAQRLLRATSGSPVPSINSPEKLDRKSPLAPSPDHLQTHSLINSNKNSSTISSLSSSSSSSSSSYTDRQSPQASTLNLKQVSCNRIRTLHQPLDQPTPEDSSSSDHSRSNSRSNSPTVSLLNISNNSNRPQSNQPTPLVAMANEIIDQLKTLHGRTSPNNGASNSTGNTVCTSASALTNTSPVSEGSNSLVSSPCVTFSLNNNGQSQVKKGTGCVSSKNALDLPLLNSSNLPISCVSNIIHATNQKRMYQIKSTSPGMHSGEFLSILAEMRRFNQLLDCCLFCEQQQLRAHKLVLAACSPFFRAMFAGISGCNNSTVVIPDVPLVDLHVIIRIAYGEFIGTFYLSDRRVLSLWRSAKRLQMRTICQFMIQNQIVTVPSLIDNNLDSLTETEMEQLQAIPAGTLIDTSNIEMDDESDDANVLEQLDQLDYQNSGESIAQSPTNHNNNHHNHHNHHHSSQFEHISINGLNKMRRDSTPDYEPNSPSNSSGLNASTTSITIGPASNSLSTSGPNDELNVISAIAALSQAAAAAAAAATPGTNVSANTASSNRRRFGSLDLSTSCSSTVAARNDQPIDLVCSSKDIDMENDSGSSNTQLLRQMQQAIAAQSQSLVLKPSHKSNTCPSSALSSSEALLSQMALTSGSLSPTTRALLLATTGLDLQTTGNTSQTNSGNNCSSQLSPVHATDLSSNATASQLMAAAQQQIFGHLTGFAGLAGMAGNSISSLNGALQPVKRGRGRPPRHTQSRDLDEDTLGSKERLNSPPQPDVNDFSSAKRWRPNVDTILALKSRNKLVANSLPMVNNGSSLKSSSSNVSVSSVGGATPASIVNSLTSNASSFDRLNSNSGNSLINSNNGLTLNTTVSNASGLNLTTSSSSALSSAKSLLGKLPNERNASNAADNKNVCPYCPQVYYSNQAMNDHINNVHNKNSTKYVCDVCGKEFSWKISLVKHQKTHSNGSNDCNSNGNNPSSGNSSNGMNGNSNGSSGANNNNPSVTSDSLSAATNPPMLAHQLGQQLGKQCNGLSAQQLLSNGDLFKNLISQRDSVDMSVNKFD